MRRALCPPHGNARPDCAPRDIGSRNPVGTFHRDHCGRQFRRGTPGSTREMRRHTRRWDRRVHNGSLQHLRSSDDDDECSSTDWENPSDAERSSHGSNRRVRCRGEYVGRNSARSEFRNMPLHLRARVFRDPLEILADLSAVFSTETFVPDMLQRLSHPLLSLASRRVGHLPRFGSVIQSVPDALNASMGGVGV